MGRVGVPLAVLHMTLENYCTSKFHWRDGRIAQIRHLLIPRRTKSFLFSVFLSGRTEIAFTFGVNGWDDGMGMG